MKLTIVNENLQVWVATKPTRDHSFIPDIDLAEHCPEFWYKCFDVLHSPLWSFSQKAFVTSVMEFYDDWSYISWKQYDSIMDLSISLKQTVSQLRVKNAKYLAEKMTNLGKCGWKSFEAFNTNTFDKHVLPFIDEDDLVGRFLPTNESLDTLWTNLAAGMYPEAGVFARKFGLYW